MKIDILPGEVEAQLAYLGAADGKRACVVDIGGASTELVAGDREVQRAVSLQIGAVRLKDRFGLDRKTAEKELDALFTDQRSVLKYGRMRRFWALRHGHDAGGDGAAHGGLRPTAHQWVWPDAGRVSTWVDELWPLPAERRVTQACSRSRHHCARCADSERCLTVLDRPKVCVCTGDNLKGYLAYKGVE